MRLIIREAAPDELGFVLRNWANTYRVAHAAGLVPMHLWYQTMMPALAWVCERPDVHILVAADSDVRDGLADLFGFLVYEDNAVCPSAPNEPLPLIHYAYIKSPARRGGLAKRLLKAAGINPREPFYYTCKTGDSQRLSRKIPGGKWKPLIARFEKETNATKETN